MYVKYTPTQGASRPRSMELSVSMGACRGGAEHVRKLTYLHLPWYTAMIGTGVWGGPGTQKLHVVTRLDLSSTGEPS